MEYGIKIGNEMHKDGVDAVADALIRIMSASADQKTIRTAIGAFSSLSEVKQVHINNAHIVGGDVSSGASDDQVSDWIRQAVQNSAFGNAADTEDLNSED